MIVSERCPVTSDELPKLALDPFPSARVSLPTARIVNGGPALAGGLWEFPPAGIRPLTEIRWTCPSRQSTYP